MDTLSKRRSLPPLNTSETETSSPKKPKGKKKKNVEGTVDASDSQISNISKLRGTVSEGTEVRGQTTASTEDIANVAAGGSKRKKKKRKPPDLPDGAAEDDDPSGSTPAIETLKASPGATRRKREGRKAHIPRSVSDEIIPESNGTAKQKGKRPRSKLIPEDSADGEEETPKTPHARPPTGKGKAKKKKARPITSGDENYHADGEDLIFSADDVVAGEVQVETATQPPAQVTVLPSQPVSRLFMERKGGFASEDKKRLIKRRDRERRLQQEAPEEVNFTTTQCALNTHRVFLTFTLLCHGLLAGYAMWQCVVVYVLDKQISGSDMTGQDQFLLEYSRLAMPASSIYYLLLALCTVSVFDRYDIARPDRQFFRGLVTCQSGAVSILVYLISLIFSVSIASIDDRISLYLKTEPPYCDPNCPEDGSLWDDDEASTRLHIFKIINLIRAIGSVLGWVIISVTPTTDYTSEHLHDADVPLWEEQQETEMGNMSSQA